MIIQCDHCSAKFRMDDSKLANGAVKVRCAKCKEVFVVQPEVAAEPAAPQLQTESTPVAQETSLSEDFSFDASTPSITTNQTPSDDFSISFDTSSVKSESASDDSDSSNEFDWQAGSKSTTTTEDSSPDFDISSFNSSLESASSVTTNSEGGDFDFGEIDLSAKAPISASAPVSSESDDLSMDFGEVNFSDSAEHVETSSNISSELAFGASSDDTDFGHTLSKPENTEEFAFTFNSETSQSDSAAEAVPSHGEQESVNFGEFSFGEVEEPAIPVSSAADSVIENRFTTTETEPVPDFPEYNEDELPPTSLTSRKKGSSIFPIALIAGTIVFIVALAGSGIYFFGGPKAFSKVGLGFLVEWYGDKGGEEGSITLKNVTASYVNNSTAGELFVVRGEAVNNFKKPRASVQIKASLLGPGGPIVSKSAFAGNSLSNEQLASLPLSKIDETMNNQFGDSLANLGLKPGASIPFVVVMSPVPKEATDYTVAVGGSTVAAQ